MPDLPAGSSAEPTLYQTICVTTGVRWSGTTTTCSPLARVKWRDLGLGQRPAGQRERERGDEKGRSNGIQSGQGHEHNPAHTSCAKGWSAFGSG